MRLVDHNPLHWNPLLYWNTMTYVCKMHTYVYIYIIIYYGCGHKMCVNLRPCCTYKYNIAKHLAHPPQMRLIPQKPHVVVIVELLIHRSKARSELCQRRSLGIQWMETTTTISMAIVHTDYCLYTQYTSYRPFSR